MRRVLRYGLLGLAGVLALLGALLGVVTFLSAQRENAVYRVDVEPVPIPDAPADLAEGERLYRARGCAECHGEDGRGRVVFDAPPARVVGTNLTTQTAGWSSEDHVRAIRHGVAPSGRPYIFMPAHEFHHLRDEEIGRLVAYYTRLPRAPSTLPRSEIRFPLGRVLHVFGVMHLLPAERIDHAAPRPEPPEVADSVAFGAYLAVGCTGCHGETLSGGPIPGAPVAEVGVPTNLTPHETGLGGWSRADFVTLMREGRRPDGRRVNPDHMPIRVFRYLTDVELSALHRYLAALDPIPFGHR